MTSADNPQPDAATSDPSGSAEETTTITLFAPFEAQKPSRSVFQRSCEPERESSAGKVEAKGRELEIQNPEAQAKVLFRKLKAAVSGSSNPSSNVSSFTDSSNPSSVQIIVGSSSPQSVGPSRNSSDQGDSHGSLRGHRSRVSPTPSAVSVASFVGGAEQAAPPRITMEQSIDPKISLTSYSDAHSRLIARQPPSSHPGGGVAKPQAQAVNKTEMLKRFGSIADNQVQVGVGKIPRHGRSVPSRMAQFFNSGAQDHWANGDALLFEPRTICIASF